MTPKTARDLLRQIEEEHPEIIDNYVATKARSWASWFTYWTVKMKRGRHVVECAIPKGGNDEWIVMTFPLRKLLGIEIWEACELDDTGRAKLAKLLSWAAKDIACRLP